MSTPDDLTARMGRRLAELKADFTRGQDRLTTLELEMMQLRQTLLRISGAIQVLEESLGLVEEVGSGDGG